MRTLGRIKMATSISWSGLLARTVIPNLLTTEGSSGDAIPSRFWTLSADT